MDGVDLNRYRFDYDLTFAALTMNAAGKIYHRYGGRDASGAETYLSMPSLLDVMRATLTAHRSPSPEPPANRPPPKPRTIRDLEPYNSIKLEGKDRCVHCHMVHTAQRVEARAKNTFERRDIWIWPEPARIGVTLDPKDQPRVKGVAPGSAAARAGLVAGDRLLTVGNTRIASFTDVQAALHDVPWSGDKLTARIERSGEPRTVTLELTEGWREGTPRSFAWRASKWGLQPAPG
ncbi:MAG: PDZ domain-containing protein, partial [Planctomycetota bacterium]